MYDDKAYTGMNQDNQETPEVTGSQIPVSEEMGQAMNQTVNQAVNREADRKDAQGHREYGAYSYGSGENRRDFAGERQPLYKKKKGGIVRKLVAGASLGLVFGLFAGGGFYAVGETTGMFDLLRKGSVTSGAAITTQTDDQSAGGTIQLTDSDKVTVVSSDVSDVAASVMPSMVSIVNKYTARGTTFFGQTYSEEQKGSGTGIIVAESDTELLVATNYHVIEGADTLEVTFIDGSTATALVKGTDSDMDLAVVAIQLSDLTEATKNAIAIATLGDSDSLELGEPVVAIGNALGYGQSVTNGIVSALDRQIEMENGSSGTFIQTNAAINPGNSGGALLNVEGEVIGINSSKIGGSAIEGMGYAIPISAAKPIIENLMTQETRVKVEDGQTGYLGVTLQTITEEFSQMYKLPTGVYVTGVSEDSPAGVAGMQPGDIITKFAGQGISSYEDLQDILQYYSAGKTVDITVKRASNGEYQEVVLSVTLGERPTNLGR